uniref:Carbamoyl phosphate synthase small chain n=1 Tax=Taenioma perpusillum TaxID=210852 RepID=A0A1Z1MQS0_9FLOR|nr:carbamoyl phosphate synthase small subunit [Taenioma perpusillum]ARW68418.1 carbamoyl phosphate synthase small subunit [Taenioma perpusillum]
MTSTFYESFLHLESGESYKGWSFFNNNHISDGEVVFNTGTTGYQEILTDPSYLGQIIVFTYPELGNTGLNLIDSESKYVYVKAIIAKNICLNPNNWRNQVTLRDYIIKKKIPHIFGLDTRTLTYHLREIGVVNGYISNKASKYKKKQIPSANLDLIRRVTRYEPYCVNNLSNAYKSFTSYLDLNTIKDLDLTIIVIDLGTKNNIISRLLSYGCRVYILPATSDYNLIRSYKPDGIILSNGPGNPSIVNYAIQMIKKLVHHSNIPIFGICMGHQLLNLALKSTTFKLKFGHRGLNHPSGFNQFAEITSQNHGFSVYKTSLSNSLVQITHFNLNDLTIGGILYKVRPIFSVQHHPEASPGPHDSDYLFKSFIKLVKEVKELNIRLQS